MRGLPPKSNGNGKSNGKSKSDGKIKGRSKAENAGETRRGGQALAVRKANGPRNSNDASCGRSVSGTPACRAERRTSCQQVLQLGLAAVAVAKKRNVNPCRLEAGATKGDGKENG